MPFPELFSKRNKAPETLRQDCHHKGAETIADACVPIAGCGEGLYHGVFRLFWNLAQDSTQMEAAEKRFAVGHYAWRKS